MNLNDVLMRQSFFVNLALKNGSKELSKELKFKIIHIIEYYKAPIREV